MSDTPESNVTLLPNGSLPTEDACGEVVSVLEEYLADAKAGKLEAVGVAAVYYDRGRGDTTTNLASDADTMSSRLLGAVAILQARATAWARGDRDA